MDPLSKFLDKHRSLRASNMAVRHSAVAVIASEVGIQLTPQDVSVSGHALCVQAPPIVKHELALKKGVILRMLREKHPDSGIRDIH